MFEKSSSGQSAPFSKSIVSALLACLLLTATIYGCGASFVDGGKGGDTENSISLVPGQRLYGRAQLLPFVPIPEDARPVLFALNAQIEALEEGPRLLQDASLLIWPPSPCSNWLVQVGDQKVLAGPDGSFSIVVPDKPPKFGTFSGPEGDTEPVEFSLTQLSQNPDAPHQFILPLGFLGPCGMTEGEEDDFCSEEATSFRYIPPNFPSGTGRNRTGVVRGPLGTYPPPGIRPSGCPDTDGAIQLPGIVKFPADLVELPITEKQQRSASEVVAYLGSTCDNNVREGACINENGMSNIQYAALANGNILATIPTAVLRGLFPGKFTPTDSLVEPVARLGKIQNCLATHKNRICGMFQRGDVALDIGSIVPTGATETILVTPGQAGTFLVHNNGVYGSTYIERIGLEGIVTLDPQPRGATPGEGRTIPPLDAPTPNTLRLRHYNVSPGGDAPGTEPYQADRTLAFKVSDSAQEGDKVIYQFTVDDRSVRLIFEVTLNVVKVTPEEATLLRGQSQLFTASVPNPSEDGRLEFDWELDRRAGTLSATTGSSVTYTAGGGDVDSPRDQLLVAAFLVDETGKRTLLGRGSAGINIVTVKIDPETVFLRAGNTRQFSAAVLGVPADAILRYHWETLDDFGTLSSQDEAQVTYLVKNGVVAPKTAHIKLTVFIKKGETESKLGETTASIEINDVSLDPESVTLLAGESATFNVSASVPTDTTLEYTWQTTTGIGTIAPATGPLVVYTAYDSVNARATDTVRVEVVARNGQGLATPIGSAQALVTVDPRSNPTPTPTSSPPSDFPPLPGPVTYGCCPITIYPAGFYPYPVSAGPQILRDGDLLTVTTYLDFENPPYNSDTFYIAPPTYFSVGSGVDFTKVVSVDGAPVAINGNPVRGGWKFYPRRDPPRQYTDGMEADSGFHTVVLEIDYPSNAILQEHQGSVYLYPDPEYPGSGVIVGPWVVAGFFTGGRFNRGFGYSVPLRIIRP